MSPENKQRVVGIIVLVAFIALLIPFLFTSGGKKEQLLTPNGEVVSIPSAATTHSTEMPVTFSGEQPATSIVHEQPPTSGPSPAEELAPKSASANIAQTLPAAELPLPQPIPPALENLASQSATLPPSDADINHKDTLAPLVTNEEPIVAQPTQPKATLKIKKSGAKSKAKVTKKGKRSIKGAPINWSVQVGSFSDQQRMRKMVTNLQARGFQVYLQKINTSRGLMVRVLIGREASKAKALKIAQQLKTKLKINGRVVGNNK